MSTPDKARILVIDDNAAIHDDFRQILGPATADTGLAEAEAALFGDAPDPRPRASFEIDAASQGQEGLEKVERALREGRPYALAFVDVRMPPGWDGPETISRIWQVYPQLQIVICTAYSDYSWDDMVRTLGHSDNLVILKKPFDTIEVLQLAHALTSKWRLAIQAQAKLEELECQVALRTQALENANQRLRTEATARQLSEERFAKAFSTNPVPMSIHSLGEERTVDANESFLKMIGRPGDEVVGRTFEELGLWADRSQCRALLDDLQHAAVRQRQTEFLVAHGGKRTVLLSAEQFHLGGEPHLLLISQDITEQLDLENRLRQSHKMQAVGQLASGVAHDFNNLLTVIQGHVSLLLHSAGAQCAPEESLKQTLLAAEQAVAFTCQLLVFSRQQVTQPRVIDMNRVLRRAVQLLGRLLGEEFVLQTQCADGLPCILADEGNLEQVILNLAINSRDAMKGGGRLLIKTSAVEVDAQRAARFPDAKPGPCVCLSVADTGCGMDALTLTRIFEPFFTTKEIGKGTGLGLATVYGIVRQHHGFVEVHSRVGRGTTFDVYFPATTQAASESDQTGLTFNTPSESGRGKTILLVEDQPLVRELARTILVGQDYAVIEAGDGVEALKRWAEIGGAVDLLLTDVVMPNGIDGRALGMRLLGERPQLKVIYTTGYSAELLGDDTLQREGVRFLSKPYQPRTLLRAVHGCLETSGTGLAP